MGRSRIYDPRRNSASGTTIRRASGPSSAHLPGFEAVTEGLSVRDLDAGVQLVPCDHVLLCLPLVAETSSVVPKLEPSNSVKMLHINSPFLPRKDRRGSVFDGLVAEDATADVAELVDVGATLSVPAVDERGLVLFAGVAGQQTRVSVRPVVIGGVELAELFVDLVDAAKVEALKRCTLYAGNYGGLLAR